MSTTTKPKTWVDNENVTYTDLNNNFDSLYNDYNGGISNANLSSSAAIVESKVSFSGSGHGHTGGTDGKLIQVNRAFGFFISGTPSVGNDLSWNPSVPQAMTCVKLWAYARTAPTGASLIVRVAKSDGTVVGTVTIAAGASTGSSTSFTTSALAAGNVLRCDVTQVGSTVNGSNISIVLEASQP